MNSSTTSLSLQPNATVRQASRAADIVYIVGTGLALAFLGVLLWAQVETRLFSAKFPRERTWTTVRCFPVATLADKAVPVRVTVTNSLDRKATRYVVAHIPQGSLLLVEQDARQIPLPPGGKTTLTYLLDVEDRVYGWVLMWAGQLQRSYPLPLLAGGCGILVLPLPGVPGWLVGLALLSAVLLLVVWDLHRGAQGWRQALDYMLAGAYVLVFLLNWWAVAAFLWVVMLIGVLWATLKRVSGISLAG